MTRSRYSPKEQARVGAWVGDDEGLLEGVDDGLLLDGVVEGKAEGLLVGVEAVGPQVGAPVADAAAM